MSHQIRLIGLVIFFLYGCSSALFGQQKKSIYSVKKKTETVEQALTRVENELQFRQNAADVAPAIESLIIIDTIPVMGDRLRWKIRERRIKRDPSLKNFSNEELVNMLVIYDFDGDKDGRKDWYDSDDTTKKISAQTVCLVQKENLRRLEDGSYELITQPLQSAQLLCGSERFVNQPVAGFCSGFVVSSDLIVTAGHCLEGTLLSRFVIVFDFYMTDGKTARTRYKASEIYEPIEKLALGDNELTGLDFAVLRVDRALPSERIATIRKTPVNKDEPVTVIGYPCGMPVKIATGAKVIDASASEYFLADVDTYVGNSGSPVYDASYAVVGVLVRGEEDFQLNQRSQCFLSTICLTPEANRCKGERISRTKQFIPYLPKP